MSAYRADSIRILPVAEAGARFGWARVEALSAQYRRPSAWIARGLEACRRAGVDDAYFEARYLRRDPVARDAAVDRAFRELLAEGG